MSKADYALGWEEGFAEGERKAAMQIADTLEHNLPTLFLEVANEIGSEVIEIIRLKSGE